uniref:Uncharacterized protein n=1 Tax=Trichogramma kaykai TaxID=54128 RepID=A0ABD2XS15_9HYME
MLLYDAILYNFRDCWKSKRARPPALSFIGHRSVTIVATVVCYSHVCLLPLSYRGDARKPFSYRKYC